MFRVAVCVTGQKTCKRLINHGSKLARTLKGDIIVVHVAKSGEDFLENKNTGAALDYLYLAAKRAGAEMYVERADDVLEALVNFLQQYEVTHAVMGAEKGSQSSEFVHRLAVRLPQLQIDIVP
ncbi:MAG TPA: universal stress protein UspA [Clostridia bacterium]|nr:universal stress protein UspA [Clostridia bacterium]